MSDKTAIQLDSIVMIEESFKRSFDVDYDKDEFTNKINFTISDQRNESILTVTLTLFFTAGVGDEHQIEAMTKMVGVFNLPSNPDLPIDNFAKINAPAILFPFVREHLASMSLKAGLNPILLQPINFVKHSQENKKSQ